MGTNYYAVIESQETYNAVKEQENWINLSSMSLDRLHPWNKTMVAHLGKASYGWVFLFHGCQGTQFNSKANWFKWLTENNVRIVDEEGDVEDLEVLFRDIETYWSPYTTFLDDHGHERKNKHHIEYCVKSGYTNELRYSFNDPEGYPISMNTFS
jgi:hypothetical protein